MDNIFVFQRIVIRITFWSCDLSLVSFAFDDFFVFFCFLLFFFLCDFRFFFRILLRFLWQEFSFNFKGEGKLCYFVSKNLNSPIKISSSII